jgi:hypothetical protein
LELPSAGQALEDLHSLMQKWNQKLSCIIKKIFIESHNIDNLNFLPWRACQNRLKQL